MAVAEEQKKGKSGARRKYASDEEARAAQRDQIRARNKRIARSDNDLYEQFKPVWERGPKDPERRAKYEDDPLGFCLEYLKDDFWAPFSKYHELDAIKLKAAIQQKGWFAIADSRGGGKTTRARAFSLWGIAYGRVRYVVYIGATKNDQVASRDWYVKVLGEMGTKLAEDFPELILPFAACNGNEVSTKFKLWKGESAAMSCGAEKIITAHTDVEWSRCDQAVIQFASMGSSIRGKNYKVAGGGTIRPDLCIIDDPQTRGTASNPEAVDTLESMVKGDITYLSDKKKGGLGIIVPCTVIVEGDLADRLLDRKRNPSFQGERRKFFIEMPTNMTEWEKYGNLLAECEMQEMDKNRTQEALNEYYLANQEVLDEGAEVSWEHNYFKGDESGKVPEISAIQAGMTMYFHSPNDFYAELQNDPRARNKSGKIKLVCADIISRSSGLEKGVLPNDTQYLIATIDISEPVLWWSVVAFSDQMTATVVDYGVYPDQGMRYVVRTNIQKTIQEKFTIEDRVPTFGTAVGFALETLVGTFQAADYKTVSGQVVPMRKVVIDMNYHKSSAACRKVRDKPELANLVLLSRGQPTTVTRPNLWNPRTKKKPREIRGHNWHIIPTDEGPELRYAANAWKTITAEGLQLPEGDPGSVLIFTPEHGAISNHQMWGDQCSVEHAVLNETEDNKMHIWSAPPDPENHFWDDLVMAFVGASTCGCVRPEHRIATKTAPRKRKNRAPLRELFDRHNGGAR